jgi:hypothetical protein
VGARGILNSAGGGAPVEVGDLPRPVRRVHDDARHRGPRQHPTQPCDQPVRTQVRDDAQRARVVRLHHRHRAGKVMATGCLRPRQCHDRPDDRIIDRRRVHQVRMVG